MTMDDAGRDLLNTMCACGVSHLIGLPDNTSAPLFAAADESPDIGLLTVTREGEAFAVAAGLWIGGAVPVVVVQNTGLLESGDSLRGTAVRMGVPLVCVITCRGLSRMKKADPGVGVPTRAQLVDADIDSVALMTRSTLVAWGVPVHDYQSPADFTSVWKEAQRAERPVSLLVPSFTEPPSC